MDKESFCIEIRNELNNIDLKLKEEDILKFYDFMRLLIEWNKKINLTAITEPEEIIKKHFIDSITLLPDINCFMRKL